MAHKLQPVHIRVSDAASGKPTAVRLRCTDATGQYFAAYGRLTEFSLGRGADVGGNVVVDGEPWCYIDGACEIDLPPGPVRVQVSKGPEYRALDQTVTIVPGQLSLRLSIERRLNMQDEGWFSGDGRCHFLSPRAALLEAQAEDLAIVNLLALQTTLRDDERDVPACPGLLEFSGQAAALEAPGHMVVVNTLNQSPRGCLALLNCHRPVFPLCSDGWKWTLADWAQQCHRKHGLTSWIGWEGELARRGDAEALANVVTGGIDCLEVSAQSRDWNALAADWFQLLLAGVRVTLAGASGKDANHTQLGRVRTYAKLGWGAAFEYKKWIEAVRGGRTFTTNGPLLWFSVAGQEPGGVAQVPDDQNKVIVRARAIGCTSSGKLEVLRGGEIVAEASAGGAGVIDLAVEAPVGENHMWWVARCRGAGEGQRPSPTALTSPVWVRRGANPFLPRKDCIAWLESLLMRGAAPTMATGLEQARVHKVYAEAAAILQQRRR